MVFYEKGENVLRDKLCYFGGRVSGFAVIIFKLLKMSLLAQYHHTNMPILPLHTTKD